MTLEEACARFVAHLEERVLESARGGSVDELAVEPSGRVWLGCLASEEAAARRGKTERGDRLDPCAVGIRVRPVSRGPWVFSVSVSGCLWLQQSKDAWKKTRRIDESIDCAVSVDGDYRFGEAQLQEALERIAGTDGLAAEIRVEVRGGDEDTEISIVLVNKSPEQHPALADTRLYETRLEIRGLETRPYTLEALPDSFRYDRRVVAYGINCGVKRSEDGSLGTTDVISVDRGRPEYWSGSDAPPDLRFQALATLPLESVGTLASSMRRWGQVAWGEEELDRRAAIEGWVPEMRREAVAAAREFEEELSRVEDGVRRLATDEVLRRAFCLMNEAMARSANGKYDGWRPFQIGFLLANLRSVTAPSAEAETADVVWFATGGGKTETYLGLIVLAAFYDRLTGKPSGITAWSRFPLRMLSLQQTQRFANAMAGAEMIRRREQIDGDAFSSGFLVGMGATPNRIPKDPKKSDPNPADPEMPARYKVLLQCPFCFGDSISMVFDRRRWLLQHRCVANDCPWPEEALPFYVVDDEIYRFLPTVVVGTLDKVASISLQAAMHGLIGPPRGLCEGDRHGYTYAPRTSTPNGCLVPGCRRGVKPLPPMAGRFGPTYRLQDELHLLKDSLGAVDAHYEALLDHLQWVSSGTKPKILASSATLTGYQNQVAVLYQRRGRVFPIPGPSATDGFWTRDTSRLARRFVAIAPRGATLEYAIDRTITELQAAVRELLEDPEGVCGMLGIDPTWTGELVSLYGTNVIYGNTLRDLDAVTRSLETQVEVDGPLRTATLTGRTEFEDVRATLRELEQPPSEFGERLHVVAASSMMSHGVDVDRLNVMVMLGLPLGTAEFIQATARVGRRWPGLVFVMHKMARERDAAMYRSFDKFVTQGDRFVEPIPITRRSRRVLGRTIAGFELARILHVHESAQSGALTTVGKLRQYFRSAGILAESEAATVVDALGLQDELSEPMRDELGLWFDGFFRNLMSPGGTFRFPRELCPFGDPMISLRDVEEQAPIFGMVDR